MISVEQFTAAIGGLLEVLPMQRRRPNVMQQRKLQQLDCAKRQRLRQH